MKKTSCFFIFIVLFLVFGCGNENSAEKKRPIPRDTVREGTPKPTIREATPRQSPENAHRVIKTYHINDLIPHIDQDSMVVLDIDATLLWAPGHTYPYPEVTEVLPAEGDYTLRMWQELKKNTDNGSQNHRAKFILLTARNIFEDVNPALKAIGFDFETKWIDNAFEPTRGYKDGVLYASHGNKGSILIEFLAGAKKKYPWIKKIIFIDDSWQNVIDVSGAVKNAQGIEGSVIYWYQGAIIPATGALIG